MWILALDVGTSSIRAIGYDALGRPLPGADARVGCEPTTTPLAAPGHAVIASGGALSHSRVWTQFMADALGVPIEMFVPGQRGFEPRRGAPALGALGRPAPPPESSGTPVHPDPRRRDIYAAVRARQSPPVRQRCGAPSILRK